MTTDAELIRASRTDAGAFRELYDRYAERIESYHRRRSGSADAALDLTAETFARAWLSRRRFRDDRSGSALPWLLGIGRNVLRESARQDRVETAARARLGLPVDLADDEFAEVDDRLSPRPSLRAALEELPPHERRALELRVVEELDYEDVARTLRIRPAAARLRVSRALRRLSSVKEDL